MIKKIWSRFGYCADAHDFRTVVHVIINLSMSIIILHRNPDREKTTL